MELVIFLASLATKHTTFAISAIKHGGQLVLLRFIDFLTVFFEITHWIVGRPVPSMRFSDDVV